MGVLPRSAYLRGDPGLFGALKRIGGKILGATKFIPPFVPGLGQVGMVGRVAGILGKARAVAGAVGKMAAAGAAFARMGGTPGIAPTPGFVGPMGPVGPASYGAGAGAGAGGAGMGVGPTQRGHWKKDGTWSDRRRPHMNVASIAPLRRAIRRVKGFRRLALQSISISKSVKVRKRGGKR